MMKEIRINWALMGAKLAVLTEKEQAEFFTGFAKEINSFDTHYEREVQMMSVGDELSKSTVETLEKYLPSLWFKEDSP